MFIGASHRLCQLPPAPAGHFPLVYFMKRKWILLLPVVISPNPVWSPSCGIVTVELAGFGRGHILVSGLHPLQKTGPPVKATPACTGPSLQAPPCAGGPRPQDALPVGILEVLWVIYPR